MTNLRLRAPWRAARARLPPPRTPPPRRRRGPPGPAARSSARRIARASAAAAAAAFPRVWEAGRGRRLRAVSPIGLLRPKPECACVSFPVSTLISVSSAPPRSQGEPELLTPCVPPHFGFRGEGAAGRLVYTGASSLAWQARVWKSPTGSEELAQARQALLGRAGREALGASLMFKPSPGPHSNPTCPARPGAGFRGPAGRGFWRGSTGRRGEGVGPPSRTLFAGAWTGPNPGWGPCARPAHSVLAAAPCLRWPGLAGELMIDLLAPRGRRPPSYLSRLRSCWRAAQRPGERG